MRRALDVVADDHVAGRFWQARERPLEPLVQLAASEIVLRPTEHVEIEITDQDTVAAPPPRPAMADVARDRAQPAVGPTRLPKPVTMTPRLKQRLLRQVLGDRMITRDDRAEPNQPPALQIKPRSLTQHRRHDHISRPGHANQRKFLVPIPICTASGALARHKDPSDGRERKRRPPFGRRELDAEGPCTRPRSDVGLTRSAEMAMGAWSRATRCQKSLRRSRNRGVMGARPLRALRG